ncbi:MAG: DUF3147 family protein [Methanobacteriota archaeon]
MTLLLIQSVISFILSAVIVILVTIIAERYGTKTGGIIGTLPSTLPIALIFIGLNQGDHFAAQVATVVPAEMGINLVFLFIFALLASRSLILAIAGSFTIWTVLSLGLYFLNTNLLIVSLIIFIIALLTTFITMEYKKKIPSTSQVQVHYTPLKILLRGLLAGIVIAIAVSLSQIDAILSGMISVFPVIFFSTMLISVREHGPGFAASLAKTMILGSITVVTYAILCSILYPCIGLLWGTITAFIVSLGVAFILFLLRKKIR